MTGPQVHDPAPRRLNWWLAAAGALAACTWIGGVLLKGNAGFQSPTLIRYLAPIDYQPLRLIAIVSLLHASPLVIGGDHTANHLQ